MCLSLANDQAILKIAVDDITCYKHLLLVDEYYVTPYYRVRITLNKIFSSVLDILNDGEAPYNHSVEEGIHSFEKIEDCEEDMFSCFSDTDSREIRAIAKCIIPKGSSYYEGNYLYMNAFASSEIKYVEIIDVYDINSVFKY